MEKLTQEQKFKEKLKKIGITFSKFKALKQQYDRVYPEAISRDDAELIVDAIENQMAYYLGHTRTMAVAEVLACLRHEDTDQLELDEYFDEDEIRELAYEFGIDNYCDVCGKRQDDDGRCGCTSDQDE